MTEKEKTFSIEAEVSLSNIFRPEFSQEMSISNELDYSWPRNCFQFFLGSRLFNCLLHPLTSVNESLYIISP